MAEFKPGDQIHLRGQPDQKGYVVGGPFQGADGDSYDVTLPGTSGAVRVAGNHLRQIVSGGMRWVSQRRFLSDLAYLKLTNPFSDVLYSIGASRTRFLVYQFQPVLKFVQSMPHGMLIADEVGLGKTIEAGLIIKELIARGSVKRVLVVCPANLRMKWRDEMQRRFGLPFSFISSPEIRDLRRQVELGGWPDFFGIASLEGIRRDELREILQETGIQFDLVIIDEAHNMRNPQSQSFELGTILADQADHILLLSATPVQTGAGDLLSLLRLIEPAHFRGTSASDLDELLEPNRHINAALRILASPDVDGREAAKKLAKVRTTAMSQAFQNNELFQKCVDILDTPEHLSPEVIAAVRRDLQRLHTLAPYYTRTRKREVEDSATRRSRIVKVPLGPEEQNFYDAWVAYLTALAQEKYPGIPATWAISMRERMAASCIPMASHVLSNLISGDPAADIESSEPDLPANLFIRAAVGLDERRAAVEAAAEALPDRDSKYDLLLEQLTNLTREKPDRKILLFTFFKGTLRYLLDRLTRDGIACRAISGDDPPDRRADIIAAFRDNPDATVLLSTEVGAEGIDLQFCDSVINYDLPWNPMRVEQRIGRIDRYGQRASVIHVVSFFVEGTIDTRILERLYDRIRVFKESIGELEPILGPIVQNLMKDAFTASLTSDEQQRREDDALNRIANLQLAQQEFEDSRSELLGQGDLIRHQVEDAKRTGRYISQAELRALISEWLDSNPPAYESLTPANREGAWVLRMSKERVGQVFSLMQETRRSDPAVTKFLGRILDRGKAWCTFDSNMAQEYSEMAFIDVGHPIIQATLEDTKASPPGIAFDRVASLWVPGRKHWPNRFALFIYALDLRGAEPQTTIVPIAVRSDDAAVIEDLGEEALGLLDQSQDLALNAEITADELHALEPVAYRQADAQRRDSERWASETQGARLATRRTTLERSFGARIDRKNEILERDLDSRIQRLHEGEIRNLQATLEAKLTEIKRTPEPIATLSLISVCVLHPLSGKPDSAGGGGIA